MLINEYPSVPALSDYFLEKAAYLWEQAEKAVRFKEKRYSKNIFIGSFGIDFTLSQRVEYYSG